MMLFYSIVGLHFLLNFNALGWPERDFEVFNSQAFFRFSEASSLVGHYCLRQMLCLQSWAGALLFEKSNISGSALALSLMINDQSLLALFLADNLDVLRKLG